MVECYRSNENNSAISTFNSFSHSKARALTLKTSRRAVNPPQKSFIQFMISPINLLEFKATFESIGSLRKLVFLGLFSGFFANIIEL
jgi:hypothetical protein